MAYLVARHKVKDFKKWKLVFDEHAVAKGSGGCKGGRLFRSSEDPNHVLVLFEWDSHENARKFAQSPKLKDVMQRAGVVETPEILHFDEVEKFSL